MNSRSLFEEMASQGSPSKSKESHLPISRVKTIMKSSPQVETIGQDSLFLVTKATELFIHHLTEEGHSQANKGNALDYKHLAEVVQTNDTLEFLREIMPRKITVRQFKEMMAKQNAVTSSDSSSSSSESSSDSDSDSQSDSESSGGEKQHVNAKEVEIVNGDDSSSSSDESENKNTGSKENGKNDSNESDG